MGSQAPVAEGGAALIRLLPQKGGVWWRLYDARSASLAPGGVSECIVRF